MLISVVNFYFFAIYNGYRSWNFDDITNMNELK
jgi:hypothetical protein